MTDEKRIVLASRECFGIDEPWCNDTDFCLDHQACRKKYVEQERKQLGCCCGSK